MKAAPFVLFTAALGFMACGGLKGQIKESRAQSRSATAAAVYGEKIDAQNDYTSLLEEIGREDNSCKIKNEKKTNWVLCSADANNQLRGISASSGAVLADEESIYQITNDTKLQEFLKKIQQVRSEEAAKKYRVALASMEKISPLPDGSYYAVYRDALKAKAEKPEKDLNAILAALEKPDASPLTDAEAVYRLREAFAVEPELAALEKYKNRYIKIIQNMNATVDCTASIKEPPGKVYMSTGYEWPLEVAVRCNNAALQSHLALRFDSAGPVSFGDSATKSVVLILDKLKGEFPVTELSVNKEENKFSLRGISRFNETMAVLSVYAPKPTLAFRITPEEYTLKGVPVFYSESYERQAAGAQPATPWKTLTGKETQATLAMNGQFTLGGQRDGAAYDMVYGHPNGKYSDSIWSSYITLSVDGKFYRFDKIPGLTRSESADKKTLTTTGKLVEEDATVTLTLTRDGEDNYVVGVEYTQLSGSAKEVGVRLLVDTWAGKTDGVPFLTPAGAGNASQIHTHEFKFTPAYSTLWETIDAAGDGYVYLRNTMSGKGLVPPDQIAFARWGSAYRSEWDYSVSSDNTLLGDSAAILWWQPIRVDSGKSRYIATRFGIFKRDEKNIADVQDDKSGFTYLYLERKNESNAPRTYRIEIESPDAALQIPSGNEQTFTLQPQERTVRAVPLTVVGGGEKKITVKEYHDNAKEPLVSSVVVKLDPETGRSANVPIWPNTKPYPVRYISNNGDKKLRCVVKSAVDQATLGTGVMTLIKNNTETTEYIYGADVAVPSTYSGETIVEIFEIQ